MPKTNAAGIALIKSFESCRLTAYPDPGTGGDPWTIGWGHTGSDVRRGVTITQDRADALLAADLAKFEAAVNSMCSLPLTSNQFSALVSFAYNAGPDALRKSTLMRLVNSGDFHGAAQQFGLWTHSGSVVMPGLVRRRAAEAALFSLE